MASEKLGQEYKVYVGSAASPPVFTVIAGQTGLTRESSTTLIDQSSKSTGQYAIQAPGRKTLSLSVSGKVSLPDTSGLEAIYAAQNVYPQVAVPIAIKYTTTSPPTTVFQGEMYVSDFSMDAPDQDNATYSFRLTCASAPTTDALD